MDKGRKLILIAMGAVVFSLVVRPVFSKTWRLEKEGGWQELGEKGEEGYLLRVSEIKKLVNTGQTEAVMAALEGLKRDYPEIAGADLDSFIKAELLYAEGKYVKAVRGYDRFLAGYPESALFDAALDREFSIATAFLAGQKIQVAKIFQIRGYSEGQRIMERISDRAGDAPIAKRAELAVVDSLEERRKFNEAFEKWSEISSRWPGGQTGKEALLGMARCKHGGYPGPKYDASNLISARSYYENYKLRYPEDAKKLDIDGRLAQIEEQMAYKKFTVGQYYEKVGSKQSANLYYQMVLDKWPGSTAAEMVRQEGVKD